MRADSATAVGMTKGIRKAPISVTSRSVKNYPQMVVDAMGQALHNEAVATRQVVRRVKRLLGNSTP